MRIENKNVEQASLDVLSEKKSSPEKKKTDDHSSGQIQFQYAPYMKSFLTAATGASLVGEGMSHSMEGLQKLFARIMTAGAQGVTASIGLGYYGGKFSQDPSTPNAIGVLASALFGGESLARLFEANKHHLVQSSKIATLTALMKTMSHGFTPSGAAYAADAAINGLECIFNSKSPLLESLRKAEKHISTQDIARMQGLTGKAMGVIAMNMALKVSMSEDPLEVSQRKFMKSLEMLYETAKGEEWSKELENADWSSEDKLIEKFQTLYDKIEGASLSMTQKIEYSALSLPQDTKALLEKYDSELKVALDRAKVEEKLSQSS